MSRLFEHPIEPDFEAFRRCILRRERPKRVFFAELSIDGNLKQYIADRYGLARSLKRDDPNYELLRDVEVLGFLGYDLVRVHLPDSEFRVENLTANEQTDDDAKTGVRRQWVNEHSGPVQTWEDFERYPWPKPEQLDTRPLEWAEKNIPDNMAAYDLTMQVFEACTWLLGYESLALKLYEDPDFVDAMIERIGSIYLGYTKVLCQFKRIGVIWGTDDMGFKSQTFLPPETLREKILPWHKKAAELAHQNGKLYFLHSCGNLTAIMDDLIDDVKIDAKHSYEDVITPVTEAKERWGKRVGILGGVDVDFLCRSTPEAIRERVRKTLDACHSDGGYALGSGNSLANYVPIENSLAMLDEGRRYGRA